VSHVRPPGVSQLLVVARLPTRGTGASAPATPGDSHATATAASVAARSVCSVMWGSAQADRSIIASGPLPRTPSPAFGLGPRLSRASRRVSSEPRRPVPVPPGPPDPRSGPRHRGRPAGLRTDGPTSTGPGDGALRSPALPRPPGYGPPPALRSQGVLSRHQRTAPPRQARRSSDRWTHLDGTRRRSSSEPRPPPSPDPAPRLFGTGSPRPSGSASRPSGRGRPSHRLVSVVRTPRQRGSRSA
jgi:hypothetical protein